MCRIITVLVQQLLQCYDEAYSNPPNFYLRTVERSSSSLCFWVSSCISCSLKAARTSPSSVSSASTVSCIAVLFSSDSFSCNKDHHKTLETSQRFHHTHHVSTTFARQIFTTYAAILSYSSEHSSSKKVRPQQIRESFTF